MFSEQFNLSYFGKINVKENKNSCDYFINFFQGHLVQQVASATRHHWGQTDVTSCVVGGATTQRLWRNLTNVTVNSTGVAMSNVNFVPSAWIFILVRDLVSMIMAILWMDKSFPSCNVTHFGKCNFKECYRTVMSGDLGVGTVTIVTKDRENFEYSIYWNIYIGFVYIVFICFSIVMFHVSQSYTLCIKICSHQKSR